MPETGSNIRTVISAVAVRAVLVLHNCLAVWRVVTTRGTVAFWGLSAGNILTITEGVLVVRFNGGLEWKWWCPCFLSYLLSTLPAIWLLQLNQYEMFVKGQQQQVEQIRNPQSALFTNTSSTVTVSGITARAVSNSSSLIYTSEATTILTTETLLEASINAILSLEHDTWIILIQESLVYLLVFGRWMLPRSSFSREALADLLLQFLAVASDIMELYAVFDEEKVQKSLGLTYAILAVWSVSFFQFIPVLVHKHKYRRLRSARAERIRRACGDYFAQVVVTCLSILLQDAPFLCLRLYIMIEFNLITYSLVFFVLKNIVSLILLFYRLVFLCIHLPGCYDERKEIVDVDDVDFSAPVVLHKAKTPTHIDFTRQSAASNSLNAYNFTFGETKGAQFGLFEKTLNINGEVQNPNWKGKHIILY